MSPGSSTKNLMRLTKEKIIELEPFLFGEDSSARIELCAHSALLFGLYYFPEYFAYELAPFHYDFFDDFEALMRNEVREIDWVAFAEAAKTSVAKICLCWMAYYRLKLYVNVDSYDKENAERLLFDVVLAMQTNALLISDFGQLYNKPRTKDETTVKRISNFITNNGIRFEAWSTQESPRGRIHGEQRPDFWLLDDIENAKTIRSVPVTQAVISHFNEIKRGMSPQASMLVLGNYLTEEGSVAYALESARNSGGRVRFIPVIDKSGVIAWPDKYVETDEEAVKVNATRPALRQAVSLEGKRRSLNAVEGARVYEVEMLLDPASANTAFFDRIKVDEAIARCRKPDQVLAGFWLWATYKPSDAYGIGADVAKGAGRDSSTSALIDFTQIPNRLIGSYANNLIPADQFGHELKRQGDMFGTCLIGPEKNAEAGGSCLTTLKMIYPVDKIYRQVYMDRTTDSYVGSSKTGELGWETNAATKYTILNDLKTAFEGGMLVIEDKRILLELRTFTFTDIDMLGTARLGHSTRHFDLLMATAIAFAMRKFAQKAMVSKDYVQSEFEATSL